MCVSPSYFTELLFKYSWNRTGRWFHMIIFNPVDHRQRWMHPFFIKQTKFIKNIFGQFWNIFRLPVYTSWSISDTLFVWNVYTTTPNSISYFCTKLRLFKYSNTLKIESKKESCIVLGDTVDHTFLKTTQKLPLQGIFCLTWQRIYLG